MRAARKCRASDSRLNCGLCRDRGILRTSTTRRTPCARNISMNSPIVRVECPIVKTAACDFLRCARMSSASPHVDQHDATTKGAGGRREFGKVINYFGPRPFEEIIVALASREPSRSIGGGLGKLLPE